MVHRHALESPAEVGELKRPRRRRWAVLVAAAALLPLLAVVAILTFEATQAGRVFPEVRLAGHNVGGLTAGQLRAGLADVAGDPTGALTVRLPDGSRQWTYSLPRLGVGVDAEAIVAAALKYGRSGDLGSDLSAQWRAFSHGAILPVPLQLDEAVLNKTVADLAAEIDRAPVPGLLENRGGQVVVVPGQPGRKLDQFAAQSDVLAALTGPAPAAVDLPVQSIAPPVSDSQLAAGRARAGTLTGAPLVLHVAGTAATLTIPPADLRKTVRVDAGGQDGYTVGLDQAKLAALVAPFAAQVRVVPHDAMIGLLKGKLVLTPDRGGAALDVDEAAAALVAAAGTPGRVVTIPLRPVPAAIGVAQVQPVYAQWQALLTDGFMLRYGEQTWNVTGGSLVGSLTIHGTQGGGNVPYRLAGAQEVLTSRIAAIADSLDREAQDARFRMVNGQATVVAPARNGQHVDRAGSLAVALAAIDAGKVQADLVVASQPAAFSGATVPTLTTPDLLAKSSTTYKGSSPERAHNVEFGADLVDGALVPPGAEFNLNDTLGPLTLAAGFQMGFGIVSDGTSVTTVPAEAGGICQVATTLFHSVFWAGLPVTERNHHSYWISSYGLPPSGLQGLDATIAPPEKNFRWRNATGNWILIKAHGSDGVLNFELWGTSPGWKVQVDAPVITNVVPTYQEGIYQSSWAVPWGITRMVEHAQPGFTADIRRQVYDRAGTRLDDWHAEGTYLPAHNRYLVGQSGRPAPRPAPAPVNPAPVAPAAPPTNP